MVERIAKKYDILNKKYSNSIQGIVLGKVVQIGDIRTIVCCVSYSIVDDTINVSSVLV
jgi:hypothetical protein